MKVRRGPLAAALGGVALLGAAGSLRAAAVGVLNPSFEVPGKAEGGWVASIQDWTLSNSNGGVFNPTSSHYTALGLSQITDSQVAYSNGATISQVLTTDLAAQTEYTLLVDIGDRSDINNAATIYSVGLYAGGVLLDSITNVDFPFVDGKFITTELSYTSGSAVSAGQALEIRLYSNTIQTNFDNVRLDASAVPLPTAAWSGMALMGFVALKRVRRHH